MNFKFVIKAINSLMLILFAVIIQSILASADSAESTCEIISLKKEYTMPKYESIANKAELLKLDKGFFKDGARHGRGTYLKPEGMYSIYFCDDSPIEIRNEKGELVN